MPFQFQPALAAQKVFKTATATAITPPFVEAITWDLSADFWIYQPTGGSVVQVNCVAPTGTPQDGYSTTLWIVYLANPSQVFNLDFSTVNNITLYGATSGSFVQGGTFMQWWYYGGQWYCTMNPT